MRDREQAEQYRASTSSSAIRATDVSRANERQHAQVQQPQIDARHQRQERQQRADIRGALIDADIQSRLDSLKRPVYPDVPTHSPGAVHTSRIQRRIAQSKALLSCMFASY